MWAWKTRQDALPAFRLGVARRLLHAWRAQLPSSRRAAAAGALRATLARRRSLCALRAWRAAAVEAANGDAERVAAFRRVALLSETFHTHMQQNIMKLKGLSQLYP